MRLPASSTAISTKQLSRAKRCMLAALAMVCFGLGWIGLFVPGLPTTGFWVLAAWLSAKSCPVIQRWIYGRGRLGQSIELLMEQKAMSLKDKKRALIGMSMGILFSMVVLALTGDRPLWLFAILISAWALGVWCVTCWVKTARQPVCESGDSA